ncbi:phosphoenolpyruvate hydrolase family protein [Sporolituus thermophilus]|uniref:DNA-binding transcriptional response regulator, NtrC family, contains REC, AAA-type ATPase, and a Fis-type DNA-binding domains n=1 Tax=Sporolituus thermophilus DSM 23256 TaxID=1123285 RepID=A0A1G7NAU5_9FIRM|nr:phosphoenolpyruvate hydrolase family protein [Sporolituus thermophilus]SDF71082.1 DNA-binding transcriptional response regulator, NtrC family, contains REC, AAA-type ATPase, and a Fis-type DNA-binding domains [Sporolituus thermophilus DSM 23256]
MFTRAEIIKKLRENITLHRPIIGVAVGSGFSAQQAAAGGADFLLVLNAGRFRAAGVSSLAALMPFANSNELVFDVGCKEILPRVKNTPVVFGVCATDPTTDHDSLIASIIKNGFHGVNNFPTVGLIDGVLRSALEAEGLGFDREVAFMARAVDAGLFTVAFVFDPLQAQKMARAGVDIVCAHLGFTAGGRTGIKSALPLEDGLKLAGEIFAAVDAENSRAIKMVYGGPIITPQEADFFYANTGAVGYIGGSAFERIPAETKIEEITGQFKSIATLQKENESLRRELRKKKNYDDIVGQSRIMQQMFEIVSKVADKDINVLVCGESGTGKELVVKAIHSNSPRFNQPFIKVNCAAIPETLLESELFGHEKGAFTGATRQRLGLFEMAHKGTLFLDEIGEMSLSVQAKLLRAIQQQEFQRVGGSKTIKVDVRIICATNMDLHNAVAQGRFREDLYYRLNVVTIRTPPLRSHKEDIPLLVNFFLGKIREKFKRDIRRLTPRALDALLAYDWPGNVRELEHTLESAAVLCDHDYIDIQDLPAHLHLADAVDATPRSKIIANARQNSAMLEQQLIAEALAKFAWHRGKAAAYLGITRRTLYNKIKKYGLEDGRSGQ